ncbi:hypothetical protein [Sneathiella limimaris]|uniref:hypothetical protein n=1 Tax=Sneathiella limimaris TaxID=1964213 RepID=UPI001469EED2|nr:hypothetical protein [Sneathiella limimaris]
MGLNRLLMRALHKKHYHWLMIMILSGGIISGPNTAFPGEKTDQDRQLQANENRVQSLQRAQSQLRPNFVFQESRDRYVDYRALSAQVRDLSEMIKRMEQSQSNTTLSVPPDVPISNGISGRVGGNQTFLKETYGPDGPSVKSVRLLAEYQLLKNGNQRLKVGEISDQGKFISLDIVTVDNSLVERFAIDKQTGNWQIVSNP